MSSEEEYKTFLASLGGGAPGSGAGLRPPGGATGPRHDGLGAPFLSGSVVCLSRHGSCVASVGEQGCCRPFHTHRQCQPGLLQRLMALHVLPVPRAPCQGHARTVGQRGRITSCLAAGFCAAAVPRTCSYSRTLFSHSACFAAGFARPRGRPGDELPDSCKLYVGSLAETVTDDRMRQEFGAYGEVLHAIVLKDMTTQQVRLLLRSMLALAGLPPDSMSTSCF